MKKILLVLLMVALVSFGFGAQVIAREIEKELVMITSLEKSTPEALLKAFREYVKEKYGFKIKTDFMIGGSPIVYGRVVEWKGKPAASVYWGGESALHDSVADKGFLVKHNLPKSVLSEFPATIGKPVPLPTRDPRGYWIGTAYAMYGLLYNPVALKKLGLSKIETLEDLLRPELKGHIVQCQPHKSSSNHSVYEVVLQLYGWEKGWEFARKLGANTGHFTARSRDVPAAVAKGEFAVGYGVPIQQGFEELKAGFNVRFVAFENVFISSQPMSLLKNAKQPKAARELLKFTLSARGQEIFSAIGHFPISPKLRLKGPPGSITELFVKYTGARSFYDKKIGNVYDTELAKKRYTEVNRTWHKEVFENWKSPR